MSSSSSSFSFSEEQEGPVEVLTAKYSIGALVQSYFNAKHLQLNKDDERINFFKTDYYVVQKTILTSKDSDVAGPQGACEDFSDKCEWVQLDLNALALILILRECPNLTELKSFHRCFQNLPTQMFLPEVMGETYPSYQVSTQTLFSIVKDAFFVILPPPEHYDEIYIPISSKLYRILERFSLSKVQQEGGDGPFAFHQSSYYKINDKIYLRVGLFQFVDTLIKGFITQVKEKISINGGNKYI